VFSVSSSLTLFTLAALWLREMAIDRETFENASEDELAALSVPD
jgi:hypothetical protein